MNLGCYQEAAEHLLTTLSFHQTIKKGSFEDSKNVWDSLRRVFMFMDRYDLADLCINGADLESFRNAGFMFK
jgi:peroxin-5